MLIEKNSYPDDFPINIVVVNIKEYPLHYHHDIEIVFVLKGEVKLKNGYCNYILKAGDIFINNGHEVHGIYKTHSDNVVAIFRISNLFFTQYFPELTKSCYRTYTAKESDNRSDNLRKMLLLVLLDYLKRGIGYKQKCINSILEFLEYLNKNFNLFAFKDKVVVNVNECNFILTERMSRIISYIYEHHSEKITLADISKLEHLNEFYLSHIIKEFTGLSFRDFLCFARAEWSEIYLLGTDKAISTIAREVGFSTTSIYENHFIKWFGHTPMEHREKYMPSVKSAFRPEEVESLKVNRAIQIIKQSLSSINSQENNIIRVQRLELNINIDATAKPIYPLHPQFIITITLNDYKSLGYKLFDYLSDFNCKNVAVMTFDDDSSIELSLLRNELVERQYDVDVKSDFNLKGFVSYGLDSIANSIHILKENLLNKDALIPIRLMDAGDKDIVLKGMPSILTSSSIPKSSYYSYLLVSQLQGNLICWGKHYSIIRIDGKHPSYIIIAFNYNDDIDQLCTRNATIHETLDVINKFNDELEIDFTVCNLPGSYAITRYSLNRHNNIFDYMEKLNFPARLNITSNRTPTFYTTPSMEVSVENIIKDFDLNISLKGVGVQFIKIEALAEEGNFEY